jgi:hypothetical protein
MKMKLMLIGIVGMSLVLSACGGKKKDVNYGPNDRGGRTTTAGKAPPPRQDNRAVAAKWTRVGRADMPYAAKPNRVSFAATRGTYKELQFVTSGSAVMLMDIQVNFTDGTRWTTSLSQRFRKGDNAQIVRLPALSRPVERLTVTYRTLDSGKATLVVNGR